MQSFSTVDWLLDNLLDAELQQGPHLLHWVQNLAMLVSLCFEPSQPQRITSGLCKWGPTHHWNIVAQEVHVVVVFTPD